MYPNYSDPDQNRFRYSGVDTTNISEDIIGR